jgi:diguanylate cyclase (GGDEF)-like protein
LDRIGHFLLRHSILTAWSVALPLIFLLGTLRVSTDAHYAFANVVILPVLLVTWAGGLTHGVFISAMATLMWVLADAWAGRPFVEPWVPYLNAATRFGTYVGAAYLTATVRRVLAREVRRATHDALTGLLNRRGFFDAAESERLRAMRYHHCLAIVLVDLDEFKALNDSVGHHAGDAALCAVASGLRASQRASDVVGRLGGDEFGVLLPEVSERDLPKLAAKLATELDFALRVHPPVSASIGVAWFAEASLSSEEMLRRADALMYAVKRAGKNGCRVEKFLEPKPKANGDTALGVAQEETRT